jgi:hypothetical protein
MTTGQMCKNYSWLPGLPKIGGKARQFFERKDMKGGNVVAGLEAQ